MEKSNDIRRGRHCVFNMHVHLVFVTKYRREAFTKEVIDDLRGIFASICSDFESKLLAAQGGRVDPGEQSERRVKPDDSQKELSEHPREIVGRRSMVAKLLCQ